MAPGLFDFYFSRRAAKVSDLVVYVRAYPIRRNVRQPDPYYTYHYDEHGAADSVLVPH